MGYITQKLTPCSVTDELLFSINNAAAFADEVKMSNVKPRDKFNYIDNDVDDN